MNKLILLVVLTLSLNTLAAESVSIEAPDLIEIDQTSEFIKADKISDEATGNISKATSIYPAGQDCIDLATELSMNPDSPMKLVIETSSEFKYYLDGTMLHAKDHRNGLVKCKLLRKGVKNIPQD